MDEDERYEIQQALEKKHPRTRMLFDWTKADDRTIAKYFRVHGNLTIKESKDLALRIKGLDDQKFDKKRMCNFIKYYNQQADLGLMSAVSQFKYPKHMDEERMMYTHFINNPRVSKHFKGRPVYEFKVKDWIQILENIELKELPEDLRFNKKEIKLIAQSLLIFIRESDTQPQYRTPLHPLRD